MAGQRLERREIEEVGHKREKKKGESPLKIDERRTGERRGCLR
jgi:hypothetical protein